MRYTQAEKMDIIRLVEESEWPVKRTLGELGVPHSTFYRWYDRYLAEGYEGLADRKTGPQQFWNRIPDEVRELVVEVALDRPDQSPRQLAWQITDCTSSEKMRHATGDFLRGFCHELSEERADSLGFLECPIDADNVHIVPDSIGLELSPAIAE